MRRSSWIGLAGATVACSLLASGSPRAQTPERRPAFSTAVDLLTMDAVAVDAAGRHVTDLRPDEFELRRSGRSITPRQAVYVRARASEDGPGARDARPRDLASLGASGNAPDPTRVARTIAIVVDDLGLSFESTVEVRRALQRFVDQQIQPGDLAAILRTAGGVGALQQFTMDKRLLRSAVDRVWWTPASRSGGAADGGAHGTDSLERFRGGLIATGTLVTLQAAIDGLAHLPGRKAVVFFSEEFDLFAWRDDPRVSEAARALLERANRAGVVLYAVDARGLIHVQPGEQSRALHRSQDGLRFLAASTGGFAVINNNDLSGGLERVLADQQGYYLIGYEAPEGGARWEPDRVEVRIRRPGIRVRARRGSFGPASSPVAAPKAEPLEAAARSPFAAGAITIRLTALFGYEATQGPYVHALLLIDPNDVRFSREADRHHARLELLLLAEGENGVGGRWRKDLEIALSDAELAAARERGLVRSVRFEAKTPGAFQIRAAVRDAATGATGSAHQFLIVPEVGRGRLAVSGVVMREFDADASSGKDGGGAVQAGDVLGEPTIRLFRPGARAVYACEVYDGLDTGAGVITFTELFRDGRVISKSEPSALGPARSRERFRTIPVAGTLAFGPELPPGTYVLQVNAGRIRGGKLDVLASQASEFEVR